MGQFCFPLFFFVVSLSYDIFAKYPLFKKSLDF